VYDLTPDELRQALKQTNEMLDDYIRLYNHEYKRSAQLQNRINRLKQAQKNAHLVFMGMVE